jgi:hypothetical protein
MKVELDKKMKQLLDTNGQVILTEIVSEDANNIIGKNPGVIVIRPHHINKGQNQLFVEHLVPREIYRNPDEDRIVTFNKNTLISHQDAVLAEGILAQYQRINLPIKELQAQHDAAQKAISKGGTSSKIINLND